MQRILISGASGLVGAALISALESRGDDVFRLVRRAPRNQREFQWDPSRAISPNLVSGSDAVIHLSGESVAGRWTESKKRLIRDSRVISTQNLSTALGQAEKPPQTFICASAIGYYGNRGDEVLTEDSPPGQGFLPQVCREWEAATQSAASAGIRVANIRIGIVLSRGGGALQQMLLPFRLGLGGKIGSGRQWWSWIHIDDLVAAVLHILDCGIANNQSTDRLGAPPFPRPVREGGDFDVITRSNPIMEGRAPSPGSLLSGAINMVAPNPVTNAEFTKALANVLRRPAIFPVPAFAARLAFGEFAEEGLLSSTRAIPKKMLQMRFQFRYSELGKALVQLLKPRA